MAKEPIIHFSLILTVLSSYQTQRQVAPTCFHLTEVLINGIPCKLAQAHQARERPVLEAFKKRQLMISTM